MADQAKIGVADALALIRSIAPLLGSQKVPIDEAGGRVLDDDLFAGRNVPAFRAAAMDGFACRIADLREQRRPVVIAGGAAGAFPGPLPLLHAAAISTGAPVPDGADWIIPQERARICDGRLELAADKTGNPNIRELGEDFQEGVCVAAAGAWLDADLVAAAAATGHRDLSVRYWPRVAVLTTGSELDPACGPAGTADSNGPMIAAQIQLTGLPRPRLATVSDNPKALDEAIADLRGHDLILSTGGVSVGAHDLVRGAIERAGARICFHGIAMRPGKPILFAILPDGGLFFGLPGNPVAALVGLRFFVMAAVRQMLGLPEERGQPVRTDYAGHAGTTMFLRARRAHDPSGRLILDLDLDQRSHILSSMAAADCWLRVASTSVGSEQRLFDKVPSLKSC